MSQQSNMGQAADLGFWELSGGGWANSRAYLDRLRAVAPADVQRVARTYMKSFSFALIGDPARLDPAFVATF
jgi:predicted Zn-dependent peptidase